MSMHLSETDLPEKTHGAADVAAQVILSILLNDSLWLPIFDFTSPAKPTIALLLTIAVVPLITSLLARVPRYGEKQYYLGLLFAVIIFLIGILVKWPDDQTITAWWAAVTNVQQDPYASMTGKTILLSATIVTSVCISDDICIHRRGLPLLVTLAPVLGCICMKMRLDEPYGRISLGVYFAVLVFAIVYSLGHESPMRKRRINMGISMFLAILLFLAIFLPATKGFEKIDWLSQAKTSSTEHSLNRTARKNDVSGLPHGDIVDSRHMPMAKTVLLVVKPDGGKQLNNDLYFRAYVGEDYDKGKWDIRLSSVKDRKERKAADRSGLIPMYSIGQVYGQKMKSGRSTFRSQKLSIQVQDAPHEYIYTPYETVYPDSTLKHASFDMNMLEAPGNMRRRKNSRYSIAIYPQAVSTDLKNNMLTPLADNSKLAGGFDAYGNFVRANYAEDRSGVAEDIPDWNPQPGQSAEQVLSEIRAYFRNNGYRVITKKPVTFDGNSEPMEGFLKLHQGNDIHYATLGTLMFRSAGIPARYVEGYYLNHRERGKDGSYSIPAQNAHAWTEVYMDGIGWTPVEVAPQAATRKTSPSPAKPSSSGSSHARLQQMPNRAGSPKKVSPPKSHNAWTFVLWGLLVLILVGAIIAWILVHRKKKALQKIQNGRDAESVFLGYRYLMKDLRKKKYPASLQNPQRLAPFLSEEFLKYLELIYKERYSEQGLSTEERTFCSDYVLRTTAETRRRKKAESAKNE